MADMHKGGLAGKDVDQAVAALKKGAYLLKYGRRGKPKFYPFRLSSDESTLIWYSGKQEKHLKLAQVSKIIPGQRTAIFQRYPRPEKEYQSFSLIYHERSLDLICKDKDEAEVWLAGLKALIVRGNQSHRKWRNDSKSESAPVDNSHNHTRRSSPSIIPFDPGPGDGQGTQEAFEGAPQNRLGKAFSDIITYTATPKSPKQVDSVDNPFSTLTAGCVDNLTCQISSADPVRTSLSSAVSSSSHGSCHDDFDASGDVFIWGEGIGEGFLGGGRHTYGNSSSSKVDALLPKALESTVILDVHQIAAGVRHAVLVTRQGEIFSWGEEFGGRLGHGVEADVPQPKLIEALSGNHIELIACGEYHTCAVTLSGDLYTWGDGTHNYGLLGHGSGASHWIPKRLGGKLEGIQISFISCGPWHTAAVTSTGQLFTFGDGTFGALGHGDHSSIIVPREVEALRGQRTLRVACGVWHTAAIIEIFAESSSPEACSGSSTPKLFTWGDGGKGCLGHGDLKSRLVPECVAALGDEKICQVACGNDLTVALTSAGRVHAMGSSEYGQLGNPTSHGELPTLVEGKIAEKFIEEIACGSHHVAVLTSKAEVYTWGKGRNGQLGHGDREDRKTPTHVDFLKDKSVKTVACGSNFTAIICLRKWVSSTDHSVCTACRNPFGFRRKRHNCYNCGLVFCKVCSSRKSLKASLAPNMNKPYRVCDDCYIKLKKVLESGSAVEIHRSRSGNVHHRANGLAEREKMACKLQSQCSIISSAESASRAESWHSKHDRRCEVDSNRVFPVVSENLQLASFYPCKIPVSRIASQTSTLSRSKSISQSSDIGFHDLKQMNGGTNEELLHLRLQVEELTCKSKHLEAELRKKSRQLKEVTAIAADEAEKCKSAKEVIMSLTAQLKEIAAKLPDGHACHTSHNTAKHASSAGSTSPNENHSTSVYSREVEYNENPLDHHMLPHGSRNHTEKAQWVIQAEPGVYLTLCSLPGGGNELKRVRFSRKHFKEQEAEKWWTENGPKFCEQHDIQNAV